MTTDEKYMKRCIQLAQNGIYGAPPNPLVGAVIVCDGKIIGEGYHAHYGQGHAEVNAIASVKDQEMLKRSTIYVSLEPCAHYGKTPPCADLIVSKGIPKVVVGCVDPFSKVAGRGIEKLRKAGCEVTTGVLEEECKQLNRKFFTQQIKGRPFITLKWAESSDGFIDRKRTCGQPVKLSSSLTQMLAHKRRAEHMGILVGTRTAMLDNPSLNVRLWCGGQPCRIVIDRENKLPHTLHIFNGNQPTLVLTENCPKDKPNIEFVKTDFGLPLVPQIIEICQEHKLQSLLVEGGQQTLQQFIDTDTYDEIWIERCPQQLNDGVPAPNISKCAKETKTKWYINREFWFITKLNINLVRKKADYKKCF